MDEYGQRPDLPATPYAALNDGGDTATNETPQRPPQAPAHQRGGKGRRCCKSCCRCVLGCFIAIFVIFFVIALVITILYNIYQPVFPGFWINSIRVDAFEVNQTALTVYTKMTASLSVQNKNSHIEILVLPGATIKMAYRQTTLCSGEFPSTFFSTNVTKDLFAVMEERRAFGTIVLEEYREDEAAGNVPVAAYMRIPVQSRLGTRDLIGTAIIINVKTVVRSLVNATSINVNNNDTVVEAKFESL